MKEWKKVKFLDYIELNPKVLINKGEICPFIEMANVDCNMRQPRSFEYKPFTSGVKFQTYDTVIARIEPCLQNGKGFLFTKQGVGFGSTEYLVFRAKSSKTIPLFVYYFMRTHKIKTLMCNSMSGATGRQRVNNDVFLNLEVDIPYYYEQQRIATILSRYDSLIENYQKQIKLLEESAQRLYKEWFVDLRFPGHENVQIVDGVPEGWEVVTVDDLAGKLESGSRPKGGIDTSIKYGVASVGAENVIGLGQYNFSSEKLVTYDFYSNAKRGKIENKDILIYKDGAYIGRTSLFQDNFPHKKAMVNEHVFLLHTKKEVNQYFLFFTLYQKVYFEKMQKLNKNAAQPGINQDAIKSIKLLMPNKRLIVLFDEIISPMMKVLFDLANQIHNLTEARDRLLPKLMSGEIEV